MQKVTIKEDGIYFSYWEEDNVEWVDQNIKEVDLPLSWYLSYPVKMEDGLTLRQILTHLFFYKEQIENIFSNALYSITCDTMHDIIVASNGQSTDQINHLYLFKIGEILPASEEYQLIRTTPVLMGVYIENEVESENVYSLSSFPIEDWIDLPISIDYFMEYIDSESEELIMNGLTTWHFFEVIHTVLAQLSVTLRITETLPVSNSKIKSGPLTISELLGWLNELDRILLI